MKLRFLKQLIISIVLIALFTNSYTQTPKKQNYKATYTKTAPQIDGLMNDNCWNLTEWSSDFIQSEPKENQPPTQQTAFKILYDDDYLYIFIRAFDNEPDKIIRNMTRRDNVSGDQVRIFIDSYYDKQTAFMFGASASGTKADGVIAKGGNNWDMNWNPILMA